MMSFAYWFAGGGAFYPGLLASLVAAAIIQLTQRRILTAVARIVAVLGALLVILSAIPLSIWLYSAWGAATLVSLRSWTDAPRAKRLRQAAFTLAIACGLALGMLEWPYRTLPTLPYKSSGVLYEVGDSLSMGADTIDGNWPALLANKAGMSVKSFAFGGARLKTAQSNAKRIESDAALIIVELGGNDILYDTSSTDFATNLDAMLSELTKRNAPLVLLELPLPPFYNRFGTAQRRLARRNGAILVPRRVLARVLSTPGATLDSLHLSPAGHEQLAQALWEMR